MSQRIFLNLVIAIGSTIAVQSAALAQHSGTLEQQMACTPDVFRLCGAQIPDDEPDRCLPAPKHRLLARAGRAARYSNPDNSVPQPQSHVPARATRRGRRDYPRAAVHDDDDD